MVIGATRNQFYTMVHQTACKNLCIFNNIFLISHKRIAQRFLERNRFSRNDMHQRPPLNSGKYFSVQFSAIVGFCQNQAPARASQCFVSC